MIIDLLDAVQAYKEKMRWTPLCMCEPRLRAENDALLLRGLIDDLRNTLDKVVALIEEKGFSIQGEKDEHQKRPGRSLPVLRKNLD